MFMHTADPAETPDGVTFFAAGHARISLALDVDGVRLDGFHQVRTVFQPLALGSVVTVSERPRGGLVCVGCGQNHKEGERLELVRNAASRLIDYANIRESEIGAVIRV